MALSYDLIHYYVYHVAMETTVSYEEHDLNKDIPSRKKGRFYLLMCVCARVHVRVCTCAHVLHGHECDWFCTSYHVAMNKCSHSTSAKKLSRKKGSVSFQTCVCEYMCVALLFQSCTIPTCA